MSKLSLAAAALAAVVGVGALAATTAPAAAEGAYFGFHLGDPGAGVTFGYRDYPPPPVYRPAYRERRIYREPRRVVCEEVWKTRRIRDDWGRTVKVVRYLDRDCYRSRWPRG
jgi:hypothetical protein